MAKTKEEEAPAAAKPSLPLVPLVLTVVVAVIAAVGLCGAAGYYLIRSGKIPGLPGAKTVEAATEPLPLPTHLVVLDPLLVNLADPDGRAYLRVSLTLRIEGKPLAKGEKPAEEAPAKGKVANEFEAAERDAALSVLGRQTSGDLLAENGKEQLKQHLKSAFAEHIPEIKVRDVLLTEFLVQH